MAILRASMSSIFNVGNAHNVESHTQNHKPEFGGRCFKHDEEDRGCAPSANDDATVTYPYVFFHFRSGWIELILVDSNLDWRRKNLVH